MLHCQCYKVLFSNGPIAIFLRGHMTRIQNYVTLKSLVVEKLNNFCLFCKIIAYRIILRRRVCVDANSNVTSFEVDSGYETSFEVDSGYYPPQMERRDFSYSFVYVTILFYQYVILYQYNYYYFTRLSRVGGNVFNPYLPEVGYIIPQACLVAKLSQLPIFEKSVVPQD